MVRGQLDSTGAEVIEWPGRPRVLVRSRSKLTEWRAAIEHRTMGFNRRKMEDRRREAAEKEAASLAGDRRPGA